MSILSTVTPRFTVHLGGKGKFTVNGDIVDSNLHIRLVFGGTKEAR